jgi:hypothetical protein
MLQRPEQDKARGIGVYLGQGIDQGREIPDGRGLAAEGKSRESRLYAKSGGRIAARGQQLIHESLGIG